MVDTPYVTISSEAGSTITWYYGSGYTYYSADMNGYYSEARAVDKYEKGVAIGMGTGHWGATVNVLPTATAFRSEGVIYESSFNALIRRGLPPPDTSKSPPPLIAFRN